MIKVYDIEVYPNLFTVTFKDIQTKEINVFVISEWQNDFVSLCVFYVQNKGLIGYNNFDYDSRVIEPFIRNKEKYEDMEGVLLTAEIYKRSCLVISEDFKEKRDKNLVEQRDLFRLLHYNNRSKMVSLKYLEMNIGWKNVQETPLDFNSKVTQEDIPMILEYNLNDVEATEAVYHLCIDKIKLRKSIGEMYKTNLGNAPDSRIGEMIFLKELAKKTGRTEQSLKDGRTPRNIVQVREIIVDDVHFTTKEFNSVLEQFRNKIINNTKKSTSKTKESRKDDIYVYLDGVKYEFGMGGIHALRAPGIYTNVQSADVSSYYTNLAISYNIFPQHLGSVFCEVYKIIYDRRMLSKKGSNENIALKAALVCVFGASNAAWSMFYDPKYTMSITVNGQLLLAMLCEQITISGAGRIIMANTDGIEVDVIDQNEYERICAEWQKKTKLMLEFSKYKKIAIRDVNAYLAIKENGEVKQKGDFEIEKEMHKDHSHKIVPIAVNNYFVNNITPEETINTSRDISLFLLCKRARKGLLEYRTTDEKGELQKNKLSKNNRYFISRSGGSLVKVAKMTEKQIENKQKKIKIDEKQFSLFDIKENTKIEDEKVTSMHSGYRVTLFNKWYDLPFDQYNVEKQFYIRESYKLINSVIQNQTSI